MSGLDKDQQWAVVMLSGAALRALKDRQPGRAVDHLEDIQAVLLGGASYAATLPAARPAPVRSRKSWTSRPTKT